ncbi:MAG: prephenate dehydrogenase/arogenate dehydrogenase family protein [Firmicutes bacterium]|nr:prephenate dehydrogenase/arogenate dehydrogenase family protein [Bacillota bacterium]
MKKIGIIGLGLIGGSLARDIKVRVKGAQIFGYDCCKKTVEAAEKSGLFEVVCVIPREIASSASPPRNDGWQGLDLIIVAVSVGTTAETIRAVYNAVGNRCIITDVCSVKGHLTALDGLTGIRLVGGHPMAGTEQSDFDAGRTGLFDRAAYIITPYPNTTKSDLNAVIKLAETIGAKPVIMEAEEHDTIVGRASHLPHMIAYALSDYVIRESEPYVAGKGFADMIRIASSSPKFWTEVAEANRGNIIREIDGMMLRLARIKEMAERGEWEDMERMFERGKGKRARIMHNAKRKTHNDC